MCRLWVAATTAGIRSEHVAQQDGAASNMYEMCGMKELVILKIQAVSLLFNGSRSDLVQ